MDESGFHGLVNHGWVQTAFQAVECEEEASGVRRQKQGEAERNGNGEGDTEREGRGHEEKRARGGANSFFILPVNTKNIKKMKASQRHVISPKHLWETRDNPKYLFQKLIQYTF